MKKLFLTVALVGGMLSFAGMKDGEPTKPAKQTKKVVVAEEAELPGALCAEIISTIEESQAECWDADTYNYWYYDCIYNY